MITRGDLAAAVSTRFEVAFLASYNQSVAVTNEKFGMCVMDLDIPANTGNTVDLTWLGAAPQLRVWADEKRAIGLNKNEWSVTISRFEATMEFDLDALNDARWNLYVPRIAEMSQNAGRHRYFQVSDLIINGASSACYDGQNFFSATHSEGGSGSQSNLLTGTGLTTIAQLETDFYTAKSKMLGYVDDKGVVLNPVDFRPLVWIPNDPVAIKLFRNFQQAALLNTAGGSTVAGTNIMVGEFDIVVDPRLSDTNDWYMFRTDTSMKQFLCAHREPFHYEDNFSNPSAHPDVWSRRIGQASVVGRDAYTYGLWQGAVKTTN